MPRLLVEKGPDRGKALAVAQGAQVVVGRDPAATMQLSDQMCSRKHIVVTSKGSVFGLKDLGSANGTLVNGKRCEGAHRLEYGDSIQIGETLLSWLQDEQGDKKGGLIGHVVGGYRIEQRLGRGAMGTVYKATQLSLGRTVALKVLSPELTKDPKFCEMFLKEARAAGGLNHPNIIQVYDVGDEGGQYFFSMEFAAKGSVLEELGKAKTIPLARSIRIIRDSCAALDYAERKSLVHRDIKPDNLMVTEDDTVKLGDLGLAMSAQELQAEQEGVFGTPHYIAPEQAMGKPIDHRADIYALGASFYRILCGRTLFEGATVKEILKKQVREPHEPITNWMPDCPKAIATIIDRMLAKNPAERYQHASEIASDLENYQNLSSRKAQTDVSAFAERPRGLTAEQSQQIANANRMRNVAVAAIAAAVGLVALMVALWMFVLGDTPANNSNDVVAGTGNSNGNGGNSNAPANNSAEVKLPPDVVEANDRLKEAMSLAGFEAEDGTPEALGSAVQRLDRALAEWLKGSPDLRDKVKKYRDSLQQRLEDMTKGVEAARKEWEDARREASRLIGEFKFVAAREHVATFKAKIEALKKPDYAPLLADVEDYGQVTYSLEVNNAQKTFETDVRKREAGIVEMPAVDRPQALEDLQKLIKDTRDRCDDEEYQKRLDKMLERLATTLEAVRREAERARNEALNAAFKRASTSLGSVLVQVSGQVSMGNLLRAENLLTNWETTDKDYLANKAEERFKPIVEDLARRRAQTRLIFDSLRVLDYDSGGGMTAIVDQSRLLKSNPWPDAVTAEFGAGAVLKVVVEKLPGDSCWRLEAIVAGRPTTFSSTQFTTPARRKALAVAIAHLLAVDTGMYDRLAKPAGKDGPPALVGLFAWLCEMEAYAEAFPLVERAWVGLKTGDKSRPLVREYFAWGLLAKAEAMNAAGNNEEARRLLRQLETEFADTRAAKGRQ
ncbi:MAG: protein kinase [Planctomycetes bacterium]|nr:protein kinase [Planctomycetota bacterium]